MKKLILCAVLCAFLMPAMAQLSVTSNTLPSFPYHPAGTTNDVVMSLTITNDGSSGEDIRITSLQFDAGTTFQNGSLYNQYGSQVGSSMALSPAGTAFALGSGDTIPRGSSHSYTLRADIPATCTSGYYYLSLGGIGAMGTTTGATYTAPGIPLYGNPICITHPVASINILPSPNTVCANQSVELTASFTWIGIPTCNGKLKHVWSFGSGATLSTYTGDTVPSVSFSYGGYNQIGLMLLDTVTGFNQQVFYNFNVEQTPGTYLTWNGTGQLNCLTDSVVLEAGNNTPGNHLQWYWNGTPVDTELTFTATQPGNYSLLATSSYGCVGSMQTFSLTKDSFFVRILANNSSVPDTAFACAGQMAYLNTYLPNWADAITYQWSSGDVTPWLNAAPSGMYSLTVTNDLGCTTTDSVFVATRTHALPVITANGPTTFCGGLSVELSIANDYAYSTWSTGWYDDSAIVAWNSGPVTATITDSFGCSYTSNPIVITVLPQPAIPTITVNGCELSSNNPSQYRNFWYVGSYELPDSGNAIFPDTSGNFTTTVIDQNGCSATTPQSVPFSQPPLPVISTNGTTQFCPGGSVLLTAGPGSSFTWSDGEQTQSILVDTTGLYSVTVTNGTCVQTASPIEVNLLTNCSGSVPEINDFFGDTPQPCTSDNLLINWNTTNATTVLLNVFNNITAVQPNGTISVFDRIAHTDTFMLYAINVDHDTTLQSILVTFVNCTTGIQSLSGENNLSIFPNPASTTLNVANIPEGTDELVITDVTGQTIRTLQQPQKTMQIDISALSPGIYFLAIGTNKKVEKFVKE